MMKKLHLPVIRGLSLGWTGWVTYTWASAASSITSAHPNKALFPLHVISFGIWAAIFFNGIIFAMEARHLGGTKKHRMLEIHNQCMILSTVFCILGIIFITMNKVINKGAGLLFLGVFGEARFPSTHAWFGLAWTLGSLWLMFQGYIIHTEENDIPSFIKKTILKGNIKQLKKDIRPIHRFFGAVGCAIATYAAFLGVRKVKGTTGQMQAFALAFIWTLLWVPRLTFVKNDFKKVINIFQKRKKES
eukprot:g4.t1